nr:MFS transporter [Saccharibacillus deserti]
MELNATTEMAGIIPFVVSLCTVASSLLANKPLYRFGTGKAVAVSILSTALALVWYSIVPNFALLIVGAVLLGFGAGAVDAAPSNYVALHFKAKHMSWLHCFWGVGATAGPLLVGLVAGSLGMAMMPVVFLILFAAMFVSSILMR